MAISQTTIRERVKRRIRADLATASLSIPELHNDAIDGWAQEETATVTRLLAMKEPFDATHFPSLVAVDTAITFTSGSAALPTGYQWYVSIKVTSTYTDKEGDTQTFTDRRARITTDPAEFDRLDSSNFLTTPDGRRPVILVADTVKVKPTSITDGKITYVKTHPALSANNTAYDDLGDNLLILHVLREYYRFRELEQFVQIIDAEINRVLQIGRAA